MATDEDTRGGDTDDGAGSMGGVVLFGGGFDGDDGAVASAAAAERAGNLSIDSSWAYAECSAVTLPTLPFATARGKRITTAAFPQGHRCSLHAHTNHLLP